MITLTRLNGKALTINALYIETIESFPDTAILLTNGRRYVVKESVVEVQALSTEFYRRVQLLGNGHKGGMNDEE
ncbi:hypothetical protein ASG66_11990 [Bacillus sp. Leaf406]|uniref:flagellar FlbD family protein n=1 Tax=Rossellomorea marisflavi TaxID=189381 RepID=UPI0006FFB10C|nr:flagellar FlbD family protein [Rossellomorea marisflavi]KQU60368.1 hypothetical protein ASG66_11990 [Bacillus sp. Leaf406]UKS67139.1 flagellar FlbD family protein [Rossellomorea marisflavi]